MFTPLADDVEYRFRRLVDLERHAICAAALISAAPDRRDRDRGAGTSSEAGRTGEFTIPDGKAAIATTGILGRTFRPEIPRPPVPLGMAPAGRTVIDPGQGSVEQGITRFTWNRAATGVVQGRIHAHTASDADALTGMPTW